MGGSHKHVPNSFESQGGILYEHTPSEIDDMQGRDADLTQKYGREQNIPFWESSKKQHPEYFADDGTRLPRPVFSRTRKHKQGGLFNRVDPRWHFGKPPAPTVSKPLAHLKKPTDP